MTDLIPRVEAIMAMQALTPKHSQFTPAYIVDAQAALRAIPAAQVAVKPLEWCDGGSAEAPQRARGIGGMYWIDRQKEFLGSPEIYRLSGPCSGQFPTLAAAKAAAQADHDTRIRAAITVAPIDPAQIRADALREAVTLIDTFPLGADGPADASERARWVFNNIRAGVAALLDASQSPETAANAATSQKGGEE